MYFNLRILTSQGNTTLLGKLISLLLLKKGIGQLTAYKKRLLYFITYNKYNKAILLVTNLILMTFHMTRLCFMKFYLEIVSRKQKSIS